MQCEISTVWATSTIKLRLCYAVRRAYGREAPNLISDEAMTILFFH
jgi:hypothetical protein